jgi:hypothetical protein
MEKIYICHCGCNTVVWKDGNNELTIESDVIGREVITHVDSQGFVNGKWSMLPEGLTIVEFELQFMANVGGK